MAVAGSELALFKAEMSLNDVFRPHGPSLRKCQEMFYFCNLMTAMQPDFLLGILCSQSGMKVVQSTELLLTKTYGIIELVSQYSMAVLC